MCAVASGGRGAGDGIRAGDQGEGPAPAAAALLHLQVLLSAARRGSGVTQQLRRSRGEKGDCRDPFVPPEVAEEERRRQTVNTAVAEVPCSTGWCSKVRPVGAVPVQYSSLLRLPLT